jgi:hypothetical protein
VAIVSNNYIGADTLGTPDRKRIHTDDSVMVKYYEDQSGFITKAAASLTLDAGCEWGGGVEGGDVGCSNQYFLGFMAYNRLWLAHDTVGLTVGGGAITNPGRYLVLLPPINGATAVTGTPYFPGTPGLEFKAWDVQVALDYMWNRFITFRAEYNHRAASVPYFSGAGGVTPPNGNTGTPAIPVEGWSPDLVKSEDRISLALMLKL